MDYEFPLWQPKRRYVCPPNAGPAWRAAYESGSDMAEIEENLSLSPSERLVKHDRLLNEFRARERFFEKLREGASLMSRYQPSPNSESQSGATRVGLPGG